MGATVVVIDTNQIREYPMLRSRDWDELLSRADDWDLRFVVPEVCLHEAISVVRRKWVDKRTEVMKLHVRELDLDEAKQAMLDTIDSKIERYESLLKARLAEIGAEIVPVPDTVQILDLVRRAIDRRAPYSESKKDGLRDTLIWHTTRGVANDDPNCEVWLVSANHNDFGDCAETDKEACPYPLHPHFIEELEGDDLTGRVSYVRTIGRLKQHLAGTYDALPPKDREALIDRLDEEDFEHQLTEAVLGLMLNNETAALPLRTMDGLIESFTSVPDSLEFVDAAMRGGGVWTAQVHQIIHAVVALLDVEGNTSTLEKTLKVAGRVEAGTDGSVKELIVTTVEALPNDVMRRAWTRSQNDREAIPSLLAQHYLKSLQLPNNSDVMAEYFKSMPSATVRLNEMYKNMPTAVDRMNEYYKTMPTVDRINEIYNTFPTVVDRMNEIYKSAPTFVDRMSEIYKTMPTVDRINEMFNTFPSVVDRINEMIEESLRWRYGPSEHVSTEEAETSDEDGSTDGREPISDAGMSPDGTDDANGSPKDD